MTGAWTLLGPKWRSALARLRQQKSGSQPRALGLALLGLGFWSGIFAIAYRVLHSLRNVPELGDLMAGKALAMILLTFLTILLLSNLITALSVFFLAKDLDTLVAAPVTWLQFYLAKLVETIIHSSWTVALLIFPVLTAYGLAYDGGPLFPLVAIAAMVPLLVIPAVLGTAGTLILVNVFPARRARDLLGLLALGAVAVAVVLLRFIRPEQLARPEGFRTLVDYLATLRAPSHPYLPSEWTAEMIMNWLLRIRDPWPVARLWIFAPLTVVLGALCHRALFPDGFSKAQEGAERRMRRQLRGPIASALRWLPATKREFILKDLRLFFRDNAQWSQLILIGVLVIVYVFNMRSLPLRTGEVVPFRLVTAISFLNIGLAGFILSAVAARFVFPAISLEGRQMWLLRSSPLDPAALLWSKYWIGTLPLLILAMAMMTLTNWLLEVDSFMMAVSLGTIVFFTLAASALALTFGVLYPRIGTENAAQIPTSFGGLLYMMVSLILLTAIIAIEAVPVARYLRDARADPSTPPGASLLVAAAAVVLLCVTATILPLRIGIRRLETTEW
jgi:ABC-2 type transport system permease protein